MINNSYFTRARLFPTVLTSIPHLVLLVKVVAPCYFSGLQKLYDVLPLLTNIVLSAAIIFMCIQINRLIAKEVFQKAYCNDELQMPTTNHLLWKNSFLPIEIKIKIRTKVEEQFGIQLMDSVKEQYDENNGRKLIAVAVSQIRNSLRDNKMLLQHNIEYGFWRNLFGGCLLAVVVSVLILGYSIMKKVPGLSAIGIVLLSVYLFPLLFSRLIIKMYGNYYSKVLYEQFLTLKC